jgi:biopolymer transport protein TolR
MPKVMPNGASGHGGGGGRRRRPRVSSALSEINVVPLVDVMLVLLIIFMVAAPMMQQGLNVNLPQQRRARALPPPTDPIYVTVPATFRTDRRVQIGEDLIRIDVLAERIRQRVQQRDDKQVFLRSDGSVTMQHIMDVMDRLKDGGVEKVGLVSRPATDRR